MNETSAETKSSRLPICDPKVAVALLGLAFVVFLGGLGVFGGSSKPPIIHQPFIDGSDESLFGRPGRSSPRAIDRDLLEVYGSAGAEVEHQDPFSRRD